MPPEDRRIRVREIQTSGYAIPVYRVRRGCECADCGKEKATRRFRGQFMCEDCIDDILAGGNHAQG
jgi:hypothetical protein